MRGPGDKSDRAEKPPAKDKIRSEMASNGLPRKASTAAPARMASLRSTLAPTDDGPRTERTARVRGFTVRTRTH